MRIEVTQEDIDKGCAANAYVCPIARAINRACGTRSAAVTHTYVRLRGKKLDVPPIAKEFMTRFDTGKPVKPFSFEL